MRLYLVIILVMAALLLPLGLIPLGFGAHWLPGLGSDWQAAHVAAPDQFQATALGVEHALVDAGVAQPVVGHFYPRCLGRGVF